MFDADALQRELRDALKKAGSPHRAVEQKLYMKSAMDYHGVGMDAVRQISKDLTAKYNPATVEQFETACRLIWRQADKREERYFCDTWTAQKAAKAWQTPERVPLYEEMIVSGAWWDLVDGLATHRMGDIFLQHRAAMTPILRSWSIDNDMWKRRTAIISQNRHKQATDWAFLQEAIAPSIDSKEFFLRKAIGWALRDYARVDADAVFRFVDDNKDKLSGLSKREALKHAPAEVRDSVK